MQLTTTTLITLLSAASLTVAAPTTDSNFNAKHTSSSTIVNTPTIPALNEGTATPNIHARVQLELERQTTFIQREAPVPGRIPLNLNTVFSAFIVSVEDINTGDDLNVTVTCQGLDAEGRAVGAPIGSDAGNAEINGGEAVQIAFISCVEVGTSS